VGLIRSRETIVSKPLKIGQSEAAPIKAPPWMNSAWTEHFFHWVLVPPPLIFPIVEGSKSVPRDLKLGFIQLDGIKMDEPGGAFVGAGSLWPEIMSKT
jgi:hypothetical protein